VVIADRTDLSAVIKRLRPLGYHHEGDLGVPEDVPVTVDLGWRPDG
jgi:hypothetical protein